MKWLFFRFFFKCYRVVVNNCFFYRRLILKFKVLFGVSMVVFISNGSIYGVDRGEK